MGERCLGLYTRLFGVGRWRGRWAKLRETGISQVFEQKKVGVLDRVLERSVIMSLLYENSVRDVGLIRSNCKYLVLRTKVNR